MVTGPWTIDHRPLTPRGVNVLGPGPFGHNLAWSRLSASLGHLGCFGHPPAPEEDPPALEEDHRHLGKTHRPLKMTHRHLQEDPPALEKDLPALHKELPAPSEDPPAPSGNPPVHPPVPTRHPLDLLLPTPDLATFIQADQDDRPSPPEASIEVNAHVPPGKC